MEADMSEFGVRRHWQARPGLAALELRDMSRGSRARTCPRTPKTSSMDRREFLRVTGTASLASALGLSAGCAHLGGHQSRIPVGSGLYGWSQYYSREGKDIKAHMDEVLSAVRDCGYEFLEAFVDLQNPDNNLRLGEQMRAKGLKPICIYTTLALHDAGKAEENIARLVSAAKACRKAGFTIIDLNPAPIGREKTDQELRTQSAALNKVGYELKQIGLHLGIHNHMPEMANGAREFHFDLDQTDPKQVGFCYDVHWVFRGGIQPLDCLRQYGNRVVSWHIRQSLGGIWCEDLDTGDIDYCAIARFVKEHQISAPYSVELALEQGTKITRSVVENHRRSREFMRRVFGC